MPKTAIKTKRPIKKVKVTKEKGIVKPIRVKAEKIDKSPADEELEIMVETEGEVGDENTEKGSKKEKYFQAVGRRKESVAIVRLYTKKSTDTLEGDHALVQVNDKDYREYFSDANLQGVVESALRKLKSLNRFKATVKVGGGGMSGQAGAIKHGLARTLILFDLNFRKKLKKSGFLTRDSRIKERRKYGHKKARKSGQWSKR